MELIDILDNNGIKKGYTKDRSKGLEQDEYALVIHLWIKAKNGEYLVQQRSEYKKVDPFKWSITAGFASLNEDSFTTIKRELQEELGVTPNESDIKFKERIFPREGCNHIADIYYLEADLDLNSLVLQKEEVAHALYLSEEEIKNWVLIGAFNNFDNMYNNYFNTIFEGE